MSLIPNAAELFLKLWSIRVAGFNTLLAVVVSFPLLKFWITK